MVGNQELVISNETGSSLGSSLPHVLSTFFAQGVSQTNSEVGVIPANTQLQTALSVKPTTEVQRAHVELSISTPNSTILKAQI